MRRHTMILLAALALVACDDDATGPVVETIPVAGTYAAQPIAAAAQMQCLGGAVPISLDEARYVFSEDGTVEATFATSWPACHPHSPNGATNRETVRGTYVATDAGVTFKGGLVGAYVLGGGPAAWQSDALALTLIVNAQPVPVTLSR